MDQSGQVGTTLANPLVVQVADAFGNPIPGVDVVWTVDGGGSVSSATTTTGADGQTSVTRTLGTTAGNAAHAGERGRARGLAGDVRA